MIKFVIVDDNDEVREDIKKTIREVLFNKDDKFIIESYKGLTKELKNTITDNSCRKIYLLDIELQSKVSGINIAQLIRDNDWDSEIIFITSHDHMFETVYRNVYEVFDFVEKYHDMLGKIRKDINIIFSKTYDKKMFKYKNRHTEIQIYLKDIMYIYRDTLERKLVIRTTNNSFFISKNIKAIIEELDERFILVHRACIVNRDRIHKFDWANKYFITDSGEKSLLLSKKFKNNIKEKKNDRTTI